MAEKIAKIISVIFHPFLMPTWGFLLLLNSGFHFSLLTWEAKRFLLLVVIFTTAILPMLSVAVLALNKSFDVSMTNRHDRIIPLLSSALFYYIGFQLLNRVKVFPVFKLFFVASVLLMVLLLFVTFRWKISLHAASIGALTATIFALAFRSGTNPLLSLLAVVFVSGAVTTSRLILKKHDLLQISAGYGLGFAVLYSVVYFV